MSDNVVPLHVKRNHNTNLGIAKEYLTAINSIPNAARFAEVVELFYSTINKYDPNSPYCLAVRPSLVEYGNGVLQLVFMDTSAHAQLEGGVFKRLVLDSKWETLDPVENAIFSLVPRDCDEDESPGEDDVAEWRDDLFSVFDNWMKVDNRNDTNGLVRATLMVLGMLQESNWVSRGDKIRASEDKQSFKLVLLNRSRKLACDVKVNINILYRCHDRLTAMLEHGPIKP